MSNVLHYNLTSGSSYLAETPEEGEIVYDNLTAVARILFGEEYSDEDMEIVISASSSGIEGFWDADADPQDLAEAVNAGIIARGGKSWL